MILLLVYALAEIASDATGTIVSRTHKYHMKSSVKIAWKMQYRDMFTENTFRIPVHK